MFGAEPEIYTARALYSAGAECNVGCGGAGQVLAADVAFLAVYGYLVPAGAVIQYRNPVVPLERVVITAPPGD